MIRLCFGRITVSVKQKSTMPFVKCLLHSAHRNTLPTLVLGLMARKIRRKWPTLWIVSIKSARRKFQVIKYKGNYSLEANRRSKDFRRFARRKQADVVLSGNKVCKYQASILASQRNPLQSPVPKKIFLHPCQSLSLAGPIP